MVKTRGLEVWNKASLKLWRQEQMLYGNFLIHEHRAHKLVLAFLQKESLRFLESRTACHWCLNTQFRQLQLVTCMPEFKRDALRLPLSIVFRGGENCAIQRSNGERENLIWRSAHCFWRIRTSPLALGMSGCGSPLRSCFLSSEGIYSKARGSVRLRARNFTPCFESKTCRWLPHKRMLSDPPGFRPPGSDAIHVTPPRIGCHAIRSACWI